MAQNLNLIQGKQIKVNLTGSFTGSFSGSFDGTGSYALQALSASYALSSSFATNALTASYLSGYVSPFPYTGSALITGSLGVTGSLVVTDSINGLNIGVGRNSISSNIAIGSDTLTSNTTGYNNIAQGDSALVSNTTGYDNIALGAGTLVSNTTGNSNIAQGPNALILNTEGSHNIAQGAGALFNNSIGNYNIGLGQSAGQYDSTGGNNTSGQDSIFIGKNTKPLTTTNENQIVIGNGAVGLGSNTVVLGNNSITTTALKGNVAIGATTAGARLDVRAQGSGSSDIAFRVRNSADSNDLVFIDGTGAINLRTVGSNSGLIRNHLGTSIELYNTATGNMVFNTSAPIGNFVFKNQGTERMRMTPAGNLGIGKTTPNARLDISGSAIVSGSLTVTQGITGSLFGTASFATNALSASWAPIPIFDTGSLLTTSSFNEFSASYNTGSFTGSFTGDGSGLVNIPASGIIGLNLSQISSGSVSASISPGNGLEVNTDIKLTTGGFLYGNTGDSSLRLASGVGSILRFANSNIGLYNTLAEIVASNRITHLIGASEITRVTSAGLGIGTTVVGARLDVRAQGALSTDIAFRVRNSTDNANLLSVNGLGLTTATSFRSSNSGYAELSGNASNVPQILGFGNGLNIVTVGEFAAGNARILLQPLVNNNILNTVRGTGVQIWNTGGSERMRITDTGNVGIGTTAPNAKLHLIDTTSAGSAALSGSILNLEQTWNTTGTPTAIVANITNTASNTESNLVQLFSNGASRFRVRQDGNVYTPTFSAIGGVFQVTNYINSTNGFNGPAFKAILQNSPITIQSQPFSTATNAIAVGPTSTHATGNFSVMAISPTYNQTSSTAANTDLLINRTSTAVGSGTQYLIDLRNNGVSRFNVSPSGSTNITGSLTVTEGITGSLFGTASFASTSSFVNTLNQNVIISGSLKLDPTQDPDPTGTDLDSTALFQSSSNTALGYDLYIRQNGNLVKWKWIEGSLETGLLYGGVVTYSGSNVFISPGSGIIAEHNATTSSEVSPMIEYVTWNAITQSVANIATQQVTYLYIDNTGALQQQSTRFTSQQYHSYIPLGAVGHFDYTQVSAFGGSVQTAYDQVSQMSNFIDAFGPLKKSGYGLTGQAGSLRLSVGSGTSFIHGGFYQNDPEFPSEITTPLQVTASMARVNRSGSAIEFDTNAGNFYTVVDPTKYDRDGDGTLANVGNGNWSIQRVFSDPKTGVLYVYYGQARYTSLLNALQYLPTDPFTEGDTFDFTTFVGFLVLKGNATNITDTTDNSVINAGLFRGSGQGSGGGIALSNLEDLTDVSVTSPTNGQALIYDSGIWQNGTPLNATSASFASTASFLNSTTNAFLQGGNSFGAQALLGTNDEQSLALETSGSTRMFISSSGNIGIGTTSPNTTLDISGSVRIRGNNLIYFDTTGTPSSNYIGVTNDFWTTILCGRGNTSRIDLTNDSGIRFSENSSTRMVIANGGNVGIGTTSPSNTAKLSINAGTINSETDGIFSEANAGGNAGWHGMRLSLLNSTGNVLGKVQMVRTSGTAQLGMQISSQARDGIMFLTHATAPVERMRIDANGNIGIGTTTPNARLDVQGTLIVSSSIFQYSNNAAITSGSTANIASFPTSSYTAGFFDFVATSGTNARAGTVFTVWNANNVEYVETSTNDIGNTSNLLLSASVSAGAIRLQGTSLSGSWSVKTLTRMI